MLNELRISNLAVIARADIAFGPGLNVLTGETGAGKSILISALGLLIGERAISEQVSAERAFVEGSFDLSQSPAARALLEDQGIDLEEGSTLIVTREISAEGRNRVRLNGRLATASTLRDLGQQLVDLHGQHEHQLLLKAESHLGFLDAFGDAKHQLIRDEVRTAWENWRSAQRRLDSLQHNAQQRAQRLDMLQFQVQEIDAIAPEADEDLMLSEERSRLVNAEKLRGASTQCRDALQGDEEPGAVGMAHRALQAAREIEKFDSGIATWVEELQSAIYQLEDAAAEASRYADAIDADPRRLDDIEARLHQLNRLKKKYGESLEEVLRHREHIATELSTLDVEEDEINSLHATAQQLGDEYSAQATQLTASRRLLAESFSRKVVAELKTLAMERAQFSVQFECNDTGSAEGQDLVEFLLSANPGQPPRSLARIASGGEISRVMLALRTVLAHTEHTPSSRRTPASGKVPIIVFDEIDSGIGGVTAEAVGAKMQELARSFQVFCVTHLPQIAKRADHHLQVNKTSDKTSTAVQVTSLDGESRVAELARMMGQESEANLRHARELLADVNNGQ